jgi:hypothetical protein
MSFWNSLPDRRPLFCRPQLEQLENRTLLSVCTVDRLTDNNPSGGGEGGNGMGDLRWCAIESLFRADIIDFSVTGTINLAAALPALTRSVSIDGPGENLMAVRRDTGGNYRIFSVGAGITVSISGLTITNGTVSDGSGGGGISNSGTLTVSDSRISSNTAIPGGGGGILNNGSLTLNNSTISGVNYAGLGGGITNAGTLTVSNSSISGNQGGNGGGIYNISGMLTINNSTISGNYGENVGGGIINRSELTISNSTIAGNSAHGDGGPGNGGGISNEGVGTLTVNNSTIAGNSGINQGGGIIVNSSSRMVARNTIIAGNMALAGSDVYGNLGSQGHNLIGNPLDMTGWLIQTSCTSIPCSGRSRTTVVRRKLERCSPAALPSTLATTRVPRSGISVAPASHGSSTASSTSGHSSIISRVSRSSIRIPFRYRSRRQAIPLLTWGHSGLPAVARPVSTIRDKQSATSLPVLAWPTPSAMTG